MMRRIGRSLRWRLVHSPLFGQIIRETVQTHPFIFGDPARVELGEGCVVNDTLFNVSSGRIVLGPYASCAHGVALVTGTHNFAKHGFERLHDVPWSGRDIVIGDGAFIASNATVVGPCVIGEHAVVAAGAVVTRDVAARTLVGGVPARPIAVI
jgi:acetyltransferase-like isoleucine patch superfamily enzyme